jgi:hypothetical protein
VPGGQNVNRMLGNRKLILDTHCEIYSMIKQDADAIFWNLDQHIKENQVVPGAVYVIGREQVRLYASQFRELINSAGILAIFSNPHEGSETMLNHCYNYGIADMVLDHKILLVGGGDMDPTWPCLQYESFLPKILDYEQNLAAIEKYQEQYQTSRSYKFLFLNGATRYHRKYMLERLEHLLDCAIWTNLSSGNGTVKKLDARHEVVGFNLDFEIEDQTFIKSKIFPGNIWGDIIMEANPYLDTYFSLVTETVHRYPYSFRTEKIWKPVAIGHPWIAVANRGFYRDMHRLGFQTFAHVIDESFDLIDDNNDRLERVATVVEDLCQQDLASFLNECYNVCKYNQQHLAELRPRVQKEFPDRFDQFIHERFRL